MSESNGGEKIKNLDTEEKKKAYSLHLLPCSIDYDGSAPIKSYFLADPEDAQVAHFRGRRLVKRDIMLPSSLVGIHAVFPADCDGSEREMELQGAFDRFTMWQHGMQPSSLEMDHCLDWMELSDIVSEPVIC